MAGASLSTRQTEQPGWLRPLGTGLAALVALEYLVIALGLGLAEDFESPPAPVMAAAALAYLVGGALIRRADRRLLLAGAVLNTLVLLAFVASAAGGRSTVDAFTLAGKAAQVGLGVVLAWLVLRAPPSRG